MGKRDFGQRANKKRANPATEISGEFARYRIESGVFVPMGRHMRGPTCGRSFLKMREKPNPPAKQGYRIVSWRAMIVVKTLKQATLLTNPIINKLEYDSKCLDRSRKLGREVHPLVVASSRPSLPLRSRSSFNMSLRESPVAPSIYPHAFNMAVSAPTPQGGHSDAK